jgi:putative hydrolase of the HAD superfamily
MVRVYRQHEPGIRPYPEVERSLERLGRQYRLGLISDGFLDVQRRKLDALGISEFFEATIFSDQFGRSAWKPSLKPFQIALSELGLEGHECVYVADNPRKDFFPSRKLGLYTFRIHRKDGLYTHVDPPSAAYAPDVTVKSIDQIMDQLSQMISNRGKLLQEGESRRS